MNQGTPSENIFARISNGYYHFTASEKKVSDYVLANKTGVQYMSISELAEECSVADATITRFCRRLGLRGYTAFKLALAKAVAEEQGAASSGPVTVSPRNLPRDSVTETGHHCYHAQLSAISQTLSMLKPEQVTRAVDLLWNARRVLCMGQGGSMIMATEAAHLFSNISTTFVAVQDSHQQASTAALLTPQDTLLYFSYSGSTKEIVEIIDLAHSCGATVILITRFLRSPGAAKADVVLQCGSNEGPLQLGSIPAQIAQLFVMDVLYHEYIRRDPEGAARKQERIAEALAEKHI